MQNSKIEWTDKTSNPIKTICRGGCWYCYARPIYKRFKRYTVASNPDLDELDAIRKAKGCRVFVGSMTDLLGPWIPPALIDRLTDAMSQAPGATFQILTKHPERYRMFDWPANVWLGATASNREQWDTACTALHRLQLPNVKYISVEPMLESLPPYPAWNVRNVDWLIVGALTGIANIKDARATQSLGNDKGLPPYHWLLNVIDGAIHHSIPLFMKNNLNIPDAAQQMPAGRGGFSVDR